MKTNRTNLDELFMMECIALARKGAGYVSPNPMVGAVIVKNGKVVGRGYHKRFGGPHAEVEAIRNAKSSVSGATIYINLEPCNYYGKTPPCTDLIIKNKISKVVIGGRDPNPLVSGKGIRQLRKSGIEVIEGVLRDECQKLNEVFSKYITKNLPFVTLKIAQSLDGKISLASNSQRWITNQASRNLVHLLRSHYDAVLVGAGTVLEDNPKLTVRNIRGRNPIRVVIDGSFRTHPVSNVFSPDEAKTILFTSNNSTKTRIVKNRELLEKGIEVIKLKTQSNEKIPLKDILSELAHRGIASLLVEGGAQIFSSFIEQNIADKLYVFIGPKIYGKGLNAFEYLTANNAKHIQLKDISVINIDDDLLIEAYVKK